MSRNVLPVYIPGGCTDVCQPVDFHFGAELKRLMNEFYKVYTHAHTHTHTHTNTHAHSHTHTHTFSVLLVD